MSLRGRVVEGLHSAYGLANRLGLLENAVLGDLFVRTYFVYKRLSDPFATLARRQPDLLRGGHILDVGANIGYTASVFARGLAPGFRVFAFEPERQNFERLVRTMRRLGLADRVETVHAAVGATEGTVGLWRDVRHHAGHRITTDAFRADRGVAASDTVRLLSLDRFTRERGIASAVGFVKIDVEGYELPVCEGMADIVAANPGLVAAVEYSPAAMGQMGFRPESILDFFLTRGFVIHVLHEDGGLEVFDARRPERHLAGRLYVDLLCARQPLVP
ncbi:MAG: FkbM family methyltransferase [Acidobacteriia bacterium]|nr:FkbM family methyltransferase [Terriglobia bacterium]